MPRIMIILDASSSMLNVNMNMEAGMEGETPWDHARDAIAGNISFFDIDFNDNLQEVAHVGLIVFGHNQPAEHKVMIDYARCAKPRAEWALDPWSSCEMPDCDDPWSGPPVTWSFKDGSLENPPNFCEQTLSHMPQCAAGFMQMCQGSGTYTHLGLELAQTNLDAYRQNPPAPIDAGTQWVNILITDGPYTAYSTNAQVQGALQSLYQDGALTYVVGFGEGTDPMELDNMACWGSGGTGFPCSGGSQSAFDTTSQPQLEQALLTIAEDLSYCG